MRSEAPHLTGSLPGSLRFEGTRTQTSIVRFVFALDVQALGYISRVKTRAFLVLGFSGLSFLQYPFEIWGEFSQPVCTHAKSRLGDHALVTFRDQIRIARCPGSSNDTGAECAGVQGKLRT